MLGAFALAAFSIDVLWTPTWDPELDGGGERGGRGAEKWDDVDVGLVRFAEASDERCWTEPAVRLGFREGGTLSDARGVTGVVVLGG